MMPNGKTLLGQKTLNHYHQNGYLVMKDLVPTDMVKSMCMQTDGIASGNIAYPEQDIEYEPGIKEDRGAHSLRKLNRCAENNSIFSAHVSNKYVLSVVCDLIGEDVKLYGTQLFMKPPGGMEKAYHQDSAYFPIQPRELVTCWTALDEVTAENGAVCVIPGSHKQEVLPHNASWMVGDRVDMKVSDERICRDQEVALLMTAGSCSFHHSMLLHRSGVNHTNHSRRGLAVHYMSARSHWCDSDRPKPTFRLLCGKSYPGCV